MKLMNKDIIENELERRLEAIKMAFNEPGILSGVDRTYANAQYDAFKSLLTFIDSLEVKDMDLEKELGKYLDTNDIEFSHQIKLLDFAKHFFELGLKLSNPITAADRGMAEEIIINLKRIEQDYCIDLTKEMQWLRNIVKKGE